MRGAFLQCAPFFCTQDALLGWVAFKKTLGRPSEASFAHCNFLLAILPYGKMAPCPQKIAMLFSDHPAQKGKQRKHERIVKML